MRKYLWVDYLRILRLQITDLQQFAAAEVENPLSQNEHSNRTNRTFYVPILNIFVPKMNIIILLCKFSILLKFLAQIALNFTQDAKNVGFVLALQPRYSQPFERVCGLCFAVRYSIPQKHDCAERGRSVWVSIQEDFITTSAHFGIEYAWQLHCVAIAKKYRQAKPDGI